MFSGYVTGCFLASETAEDLATAIIQATTPIRQSTSLLLRVDKAPGLVKLANASQSLLSDVGITLELAQDENKNSNCVVDKSINELEAELRKLSPSGAKLNSANLAQALMSLNSKVRNRGFTAAEIHFARDSHDHVNLHLNDNDLMEKQKSLRLQNHAYLSKSRAPKTNMRASLKLKTGDIVFSKHDGSKHASKDPYIVVDAKNSNRTTIRKALHTSPYATGNINLSPHIKLVNNKFLYKPSPSKSKNASEPILLSDFDVDIQTALVQPPPIDPPWSPVGLAEDSNDLIPVMLSNTQDHIDSDLGPPSELNASNDIDEHSIHASTESSLSTCRDSVDSDGHLPDSDTSPEVVIFEDGEGHGIPEKLLQHRKPIVGDHISYFHDKKKTWTEAIITKDLSKKWKHYFNIRNADGEEDGLYLRPDTRWTLIPTNAIETERSHYDLNALKPTPESTFLQQDSSNNSTVTSPPLEDHPASQSLEWDMLGVELDTSLNTSNNPFSWLPPIDVGSPSRVNYLAYHLPLTSTPQRHTPSHGDTFIDLNARLPIPTPPHHHEDQINQLNRSLPLDLTGNRDCLPTFIKKFLPFKKKKQ